jgi:hypothetical protein
MVATRRSQQPRPAACVVLTACALASVISIPILSERMRKYHPAEERRHLKNNQAATRNTFRVKRFGDADDVTSYDPSNLGETGRLAESMETAMRSQGNGVLSEEAVIIPPQEARVDGVYVYEYSQLGPSNTAICSPAAGEICEIADNFSRAGYVLRQSVDDQIGREAISLETQNVCICIDRSCVQIAEVRVVALFNSSATILANKPERHSCVLRQKDNMLSGCAQSLLTSSVKVVDDVNRSIIANAPGLYPSPIMPWEFPFNRNNLQWSARGNRGYVNTMLSEDFEALSTIKSSDKGNAVNYTVVPSPPRRDDWEWVRFENKSEGEHCAAVADWALHAASRQATTLDDTGRGVNEDAFYSKLPTKTSLPLILLAAGQALLGLATLHQIMVKAYLKGSEFDSLRLSRVPDAANRHCTLCMNFRIALTRRECSWWVLGFILFCLESLALTELVIEETKAARASGHFVYMGLVGALARATGKVPSNINERGNVIVATVIVGTAKYTGTSARALLIVLAVAFVLALISVNISFLCTQCWWTYEARQIEMSDIETAEIRCPSWTLRDTGFAARLLTA